MANGLIQRLTQPHSHMPGVIAELEMILQILNVLERVSWQSLIMLKIHMALTHECVKRTPIQRKLDFMFYLVSLLAGGSTLAIPGSVDCGSSGKLHGLQGEKPNHPALCCQHAVNTDVQ